MAEKTEKKIMISDVVSGLLFMLVGLGVFYMTNSMPVISQNTLGSAFWPRIVAVILIALGAAQTVIGLIVKQKKSYFHLDEDKKKNIFDFFSVIVLLLFYGALWNRVPFLISTPIFIILTSLVIRLKRKIAIILAVLMPAILYLIFRIGLSVMIK
jgi:hypothetical protein